MEDNHGLHHEGEWVVLNKSSTEPRRQDPALPAPVDTDSGDSDSDEPLALALQIFRQVKSGSNQNVLARNKKGEDSGDDPTITEKITITLTFYQLQLIALVAFSVAIAVARSSSSYAGVASCIKPHWRASGTLKIRPIKLSSIARRSPNAIATDR